MAYAFWKNKKVLITGYEGFLGSWLTKFLTAEGAVVSGLDIKVNRKDSSLDADDRKAVKICKGTVADIKLVDRIIRSGRTDFVFHLAAEAIVGDCYSHPLKAFESNIKGTWSVLEACRLNKSVKGLIVASTDKAYGSHKDLPYKEDYPLIADHPYDVSKSCADLISNTYANSYGLAVCVTRCGNLYGPGDFNFSRLVPDTILSALDNRILSIRSDGKFVRDYVYVKDIASAYMLLGQRMLSAGLKAEAFNFSDEKPLSVLEIVKKIYSIMGVKPRYRILDRAEFEIRDQYLDSSKARKLLNWKPAYGIDEALKETIAWYRMKFGRANRCPAENRRNK